MVSTSHRSTALERSNSLNGFRPGFITLDKISVPHGTDVNSIGRFQIVIGGEAFIDIDCSLFFNKVCSCISGPDLDVYYLPRELFMESGIPSHNLTFHETRLCFKSYDSPGREYADLPFIYTFNQIIVPAPVDLHPVNYKCITFKTICADNAFQGSPTYDHSPDSLKSPKEYTYTISNPFRKLNRLDILKLYGPQMQALYNTRLDLPWEIIEHIFSYMDVVYKIKLPGYMNDEAIARWLHYNKQTDPCKIVRIAKATFVTHHGMGMVDIQSNRSQALADRTQGYVTPYTYLYVEPSP
mgnify:CR=1 FL=1